MSDNKYLEKVALNALKARRMAKSVGLIADHTSQWKWALRNLRDNKGNALAGKALSDAKRRLGSIDNNSYQKIIGTARKQRLGVEVGAHSTNGAINKIDIGQQGYLHYSSNATNTSTVHTHPDYSRNIIKQHIKEYPEDSHLSDLVDNDKKHRMTEMSGKTYFNNKYLSHYVKSSKNHREVSSVLERMSDRFHSGESVNVSHLNQGLSFEKKLRDNVENSKRILLGSKQDDLAAFSHFGANKTHSIISPDFNAEAIHKIKHDPSRVPLSKRTIYFNRNPRNTIADNL